MQLPLLCEKSGAIALVLPGFTAEPQIHKTTKLKYHAKFLQLYGTSVIK